MRPKIEYLQTLFRKYNEQYFYSKLPMPTFELINSRHTLGSYCAATEKHDHLIRITEAYEGAEIFFQNTLIHEMIHYYLRYIGDEDTGWACHHGKNFKREAARINKEGWKIQRLATKDEMKQVRLVAPSASFMVRKVFTLKTLLKYPMDEQELISFIQKSRRDDKDVVLWFSYPTLQRMVYAELQEDDCTEEYRIQRCKAIVKAYKSLIRFNYGNHYHLYVLHSDLSHFYHVMGNVKLAEEEYDEAFKLKDAQPTSNYRFKGEVIHPIQIMKGLNKDG